MDLALARRLQDVSALDLLAQLSEPERRATVTRNVGVLDVGDALTDAMAESDAQMEEGVGLSVSIKEMEILQAKDWWSLDGRGEIYVITSILDGSGTHPEFTTERFDGIADADRLPLGEGGMLAGALVNPRWFVDLHVLIMESDSELKNLGTYIEKAKEQSGLKELLDNIGALAALDPTKVTQVAFVVNAFLGLLTAALAANGDDHVATIHDFYLKSQGFGVGRHPREGLQTFQGVQAAYEMDLQGVT